MTNIGRPKKQEKDLSLLSEAEAKDELRKQKAREAKRRQREAKKMADPKKFAEEEAKKMSNYRQTGSTTVEPKVEKEKNVVVPKGSLVNKELLNDCLTEENLRNLEIIHSRLFSKEMKGIIWVYEEWEEILDGVNGMKLSNNTKKKYFATLMKAVKCETGNNDVVYKLYKEEFDKYVNKIGTIENKNVLNEAEKKKYKNIDEIRKDLKDFEPKNERDKFDKMVVELMLQSPYGFRDDISGMKIFKTTKKRKFKNDGVGNWIVDDGKNIRIVMNEYKTSKKYGSQDRPVQKNSGLERSLREWMANKKHGSNLFIKEDGTEYKRMKDGVAIAMKRITKKPININLVRKLLISEWYNKKPRSIEDEKEHAKKFLHSLDEHRVYKKVDV